MLTNNSLYFVAYVGPRDKRGCLQPYNAELNYVDLDSTDSLVMSSFFSLGAFHAFIYRPTFQPSKFPSQVLSDLHFALILDPL